MKQREIILQSLATDKKVDQIIKNICPSHREDVKQELFLVLCQIPEFKLLDLYKKNVLKYWIIRTVENFCKKDSCFDSKIKKFSRNNIAGGNDYVVDMFYREDSAKTDTLEILREAINNLPEFDRRFMNLYLEVNSGEKMAPMLNVGAGTIYKRLERIKGELKAYIARHSEPVEAITSPYLDCNDDDDEERAPFKIPPRIDKAIERFDIENENGPIRNYAN